MALVVKSFNDMVDDILDRIVAADIGFDDKSKGSTLRTIIEAIVSELDIQYYQLQYIYDMMCIDTSTASDLDKLVSILGVIRNPATACTGQVVFKCNNPAPYDIPIPSGTTLSTRPDISGKVYTFVTTADVTMTTGSTQVTVEIKAQVPGAISLRPHTIVIMNDPIVGISSVDNSIIVSGGSDQETDDALRYRAKLALSELGKSTSKALEGALMDDSDVYSVKVLDQNRGVGTADIVVTPHSIPPSSELQTRLSAIVSDTKAAGVSVNIIYPTLKVIDISINLLTVVSGVNMTTVRNSVGNAILAYANSLNDGDTFIVKQMESHILSLVNSVRDIQTVAPTANVTADIQTIVRAGTITIDGTVWTNG